MLFFLKDIKILQVNFIKIYIIHKIFVLLKITRILKLFLKGFYFFSQQSSSFEEENIIKDVRNLFRLKKEIDDTAIKK